ncbi:hypothetical protein [Streptomyces sp. CRN 30]|uniref:hypothetical protein n=1 Tax=Streptomyces sp. CRN 30 TaxID=3075613 RepID=UPI002A812BDF|nr:hypothetical protein [Streptomyces sp. CRN 30]
MMWQGLAGVLTGGLSRFRVVGLLPAVFFVSLVLAVWALGDPPCWSRLTSAVDGLGSRDLVLLALGIACLVLLANAFQLPLIRLLEGYWTYHPCCPAGLATALGARHRWRLRRLREQSEGGAPGGTRQHVRTRKEAWRAERTALTESRQRYATERLLQEFLDPAHILPTRLGNALHTAEQLPAHRYGLDAVTFWPALYSVMGPRLKEAVDDQRDQLDFAVRVTAATALSVPVTLVRFLCAGSQGLPWLWVPVALTLVSLGAYRTAVSAAVMYGVLIRTAFDLHRFDLLTALHLPLPDSSADELEANRELSRRMSAGRRGPLRYEHPAPDWRPPSAQPPAAGT